MYKFHACHQKPERSFFWKGKQFPLCARCTGIYIAFVPFSFLFIFFDINIWYSILLLLPAYLDGSTQLFFKRESNNILRVITGFLCGIGLASLASCLGKFIGNFILEYILNK
ncbi:DUF2085 domain-containing protein [Apibacter adventoris]|uniref:DUF2085 domain-containing protein n=1 Tax=Apibacter adventoris TaxID=1679466 RepID=A0A2S8ADN5_9FLAO|nr:DUF2085 domain-containing protein [Apibacter adventoris]PQL93072.1 hypothetical protein C4S77_05250 [Apibacter adventoris]